MAKTKKALPIAEDNLCEKCVALCCNYVTIEVDKPTNKLMRDDVRWYLLHEGVTVLITGGQWSVKLPSRCMALNEDNSCSIYETRPQACRDYSTENCDYHTVFGDWGTEYTEIETPGEFEEYLEKEKRKRAEKKKKAQLKAASRNGKKSGKEKAKKKK